MAGSARLGGRRPRGQSESYAQMRVGTVLEPGQFILSFSILILNLGKILLTLIATTQVEGGSKQVACPCNLSSSTLASCW